MNNIKNLKEITFRDTLSIVFRYKFTLINSILIIMTLVFLGLQLQTPIYKAVVTFQIKGVGQVDAPTYKGIGYFRIHITQINILKLDPVVKRAVKALDLDKVPLDYEKQFCSPIKKYLIDLKLSILKNKLKELTSENQKKYLFDRTVKLLKEKIKAELIPHADIFKVFVEDYSPEQAIKIANVLSRSYLVFDLEQQLAELQIKYGEKHPSILLLRHNIKKTKTELNGKKLDTLEALGSASVKIVEQARSTYIPVGKSKKFLLLVTFFVSIFVGLALIFFFDFMDHSFKTPEDIVNKLNIPFLGSIIKRKFRKHYLIKDTKKENKYTQFYDELSTEIYTFLASQKLKSIIMASFSINKKPAIAICNIGYLLSKRFEYKTLIIDADIRNPKIHRFFNLENEKGLADVIKGDKGQYIIDIDENLSLLPAGQAKQDPINLLKKFDLEEILKNTGFTKNNFNVILINSSNINDYKDVAILSIHVDGVALMINQGKERVQVVKNSIQSISNKRVKIIGGILCNRKFYIPKFLYKRI